MAFIKVGDVGGNPYLANVGDGAGAMTAYSKALALMQALADAEPSADNRAGLATSHHRVADMLWSRGDNAAAAAHVRTVVALRSRT